jgi:hypothetical protein
MCISFLNVQSCDPREGVDRKRMAWHWFWTSKVWGEGAQGHGAKSYASRVRCHENDEHVLLVRDRVRRPRTLTRYRCYCVINHNTIASAGLIVSQVYGQLRSASDVSHEVFSCFFFFYGLCHAIRRHRRCSGRDSGAIRAADSSDLSAWTKSVE